jgi:hypothetical protein
MLLSMSLLLSLFLFDVCSMILEQSGLQCLDVGYEAMITMMRNTTWGSPADGMRQWIYQVVNMLLPTH